MSELEKYKYSVYRCLRCGICRAKYNCDEKVFRVCPAGEHSAGFWTNYAGGRIALAREILDGRLKITDVPAEAVYECLLCGNCKEKCGSLDMTTFQPLIDSPAICKALRADMFAAGVAVPEGVRMFGENLEKTHNVFGAPVEERVEWLTPDIKVETDADTIFFPGCLAAYRAPEIALATAKILNKAGIKFSVIGEEEWCCGNPLLMTGQLALAREIAQHNLEALKGKRIITSCAGCFRCFKEEYPKLMGEEAQLNMVHIVELLPELIESGKIKFKPKKGKKEIVTYHDPCELGRVMGVYEPPRQVINAIPGVELVEMARNQANSWCCGGGGGLKGVKWEMAVEIGTDRIKEALATGAKRIISACASCKINLNDAIRSMGKEAEIKAIDITELVVEAAGL